MTRVYNMKKDEWMVYSCEPLRALISAYEQSKNNWSTWSYAHTDCYPIIEGKKTFSLGDFCIMKKS